MGKKQRKKDTGHSGGALSGNLHREDAVNKRVGRDEDKTSQGNKDEVDGDGLASVLLGDDIILCESPQADLGCGQADQEDKRDA